MIRLIVMTFLFIGLSIVLANLERIENWWYKR